MLLLYMHYFEIGSIAALITIAIGLLFYHSRWNRFGSITVLIGFFAVLWYVAIKTPYLLDASIKVKHLVGLTLAGIIVYAGAYLDYKKRMRAPLFFLSVIFAAAVIVASGIGVRAITNPFGDVISLVQWEHVLFWWQGIGYRITLPADIITLFWLFIVIYTMRRLNTLDGLASGITAIGALMIFFLAAATKYFQPEVAALAIIAAGVFVGMLIYNWHPAKIRLGAGGAAFAGATLGTLAIISGGKIATTLLVLGVPVIDVAWGWVRRIIWINVGRWFIPGRLSSGSSRRGRGPTAPEASLVRGRQAPALQIAAKIIAERKQLPYRLLDAGFSHRGAVIFLLCISAAFGATALVLQSAQKLIALAVLGAIAALLLIVGSVAEPVADTPRGTRRRRMILGVPVDSMAREDAVLHVEALLKSGGQHIITTPNPEMLVDAARDPKFKGALNRAALALPDGFGLMLAARLLKQPLAARVPGVDFVLDLARLAAEKGYTMYLFGAEEGIAAAAAEKLKIKNEELRIVGAESGLQYDETQPPADRRPSLPTFQAIIQRINYAQPDILLVALGHGKQEKWIAAHLREMPSVKIAMGVGGTLDFIAGRVARAPRLLRLLGMEWLWRLLRQPWRLPRIWRAVVVFPFLVLKSRIKH